ncbi:type VII secretion protein EccB [Streptomyces endophytica]|uniref:type VII secretion protein EccB n=1 Tax=Streptomyces endophytica TaxID=2991496 RepID=UPI00311B306E
MADRHRQRGQRLRPRLPDQRPGRSHRPRCLLQRLQGHHHQVPGRRGEAARLPERRPGHADLGRRRLPRQDRLGRQLVRHPRQRPALHGGRHPKVKSGSLFLVTDTGLRYFIPRTNDSATQAGSDKQEVDQARIHLGYGGTHPPLILKAWSTLLSNGPALDIRSAKQPQSS